MRSMRRIRALNGNPARIDEPQSQVHLYLWKA